MTTLRLAGRSINPVALWSHFCEIKDEEGPFLSLTYCPNPEHDNSHSPAFQINISQPTVHCFTHCGISGSYEHALCVIHGLYNKYRVEETKDEREKKARKRSAYRDARRIIFTLAKSKEKVSADLGTSSVATGRDKRKTVLASDSENFLLGKYSYLPKQAFQFLSKRGIDESSRMRWQIGFDEKQERIVIPVYDEKNRLRFLIRRGVYAWQRPAYLYPFESGKSRLLFGTCFLDRDRVSSEGLIVVEGSLDCIRLHQHGYTNTVAMLGNSISRRQQEKILLLNPKQLYLFVDKDTGGAMAFSRLVKMTFPFPIKIPLYPKGDNLDPAVLTKKQIERALLKSVSPLKMKQRMREQKGDRHLQFR